MAAGQFHTLSFMAFSGPCSESRNCRPITALPLLCGGLKRLTVAEEDKIVKYDQN